MPLPEGATYSDKITRTLVRLADGRLVTRAEAMNIGAQEIDPFFRTDYMLRQARKEIKSAQKSDRYRQDHREIRRNNPDVRQRDIDRVMLRLYAERQRQKEVGRRTMKSGDKSMGSAIQEWNSLVGRAVGKDWSRY
ncbi:hypothetical protein AB0D86_48115 [Streptomyces sp. NPDC048324]|uniref:hypothetical protein n=1 Tax=Streptomyces sp. NPDC048324 TaxID=3157205 RepID=UPI0034467BEB